MIEIPMRTHGSLIMNGVELLKTSPDVRLLDLPKGSTPRAVIKIPNVAGQTDDGVWLLFPVDQSIRQNIHKLLVSIF